MQYLLECELLRVIKKSNLFTSKAVDIFIGEVARDPRGGFGSADGEQAGTPDLFT